MRIDHVIWATADLDAASEQVEEELGLTVVEGGRHEGMGTVNRIVPLGGGYLELLTVADAEEAAESVLGRAVLARLAGGEDGFLGWAVAVDDVAPVAARLGMSITTISRDGLSARLTGLVEAMREPMLPLFVARDRGVADPGATGAVGGISGIELSGDAGRLESWLGGAELPVRVSGGRPAVLAFGLGERRIERLWGS